MFVRVLDPLVITFAILVLDRVRIRIAMIPKDGDELLALLISLELVPGQQFLGRDNRLDVLDPFFEGFGGFRLELEVWFADLLQESSAEQRPKARTRRASRELRKGSWIGCAWQSNSFRNLRRELTSRGDCLLPEKKPALVKCESRFEGQCLKVRL